jgi:hypothetical protein
MVTKVNVVLLLAVQAVKLRTGGLLLAGKDVPREGVHEKAGADESIVDLDDCACEEMPDSGTATVALQTRQEVADCGNETNGCDTVMFVHYHKTGCRLSRELLDLFFNGHGKAMAREMEGPLERRVGGSCPSLVSLTEHKQFVMEAPDLDECSVGSTFPADTKVVHFVRDPYRMAVSGFLYHTQAPTPEKWVLQKLPICGNDTHVQMMSQTLGLDIEPVRHLYETLSEQVRHFGRRANFYEDLRGLDRKEGLRLWTSFAICSGMHQAGGDMVRMPFNAQWFAKNKMRVHTIYMDEWIGQTQAEFSGLYDFLGITSLPRNISEVQPQNIFHPEGRVKSHNHFHSAGRGRRQHVTEGKISERERDRLIAALRADDVLRPYLDLMHGAK